MAPWMRFQSGKLTEMEIEEIFERQRSCDFWMESRTCGEGRYIMEVAKTAKKEEDVTTRRREKLTKESNVT